MANKVTLDFENNIITWDTDTQKGTEHCPDLDKRKDLILKAMGYESVNISPVIHSINDFLNGKITKKDLLDKFDEFEKE